MAIDFAALDAYMKGLQAQQAAAVAGSGLEGPDPTEIAQWSNQRRQVQDQLGNTQATLGFQRSNALAGQSAETGQLAHKWDTMRNNLPGQFAKRGLLNSGIYGGGLQEYGRNRADEEGNLALKYQQQLGGYDLQGRQAQGAYGSGMAQIDQSEQARRASLAAQLKGVV